MSAKIKQEALPLMIQAAVGKKCFWLNKYSTAYLIIRIPYP
jgi:hypothetical protein